MKTKNLFLSLLMSVVFVFGIANSYAVTDKKEKKTIVLKAELHCKTCVAKIEKNIPFEKGVKDLKVDMKANTITVTYRADKNNKENIVKAIEKLGIKVFKNDGCQGKCGANCCKVTGDKSKCCKKSHHHHHDKAKCDSKCSKKHECKGKCSTEHKCEGKCSKDHKCSGDCKTCKDKKCKEHKCTGNCKTCKDKSCKKAGTDAKCDKKHNCKGCSGCSK